MTMAPYESIPTAKWVEDQIKARAADLAAHGPSAGRHPVDMNMEGGMI
jgi:hypothetical protein